MNYEDRKSLKYNLAYLLKSQHRVKKEHLIRFGVRPNDIRLDSEKKILLGICFRSHDHYSFNRNMMDLLIKKEKEGYKCFIGLVTPGNWSVLDYADTLDTMRRRTANSEWVPSKEDSEYTGHWLWLDEEGEVAGFDSGQDVPW